MSITAKGVWESGRILFVLVLAAALFGLWMGGSVGADFGLLSVSAMASLVGAGRRVKAWGYIALGTIGFAAGVAAIILCPPAAPAVIAAVTYGGGALGAAGGLFTAAYGACELLCN